MSASGKAILILAIVAVFVVPALAVHSLLLHVSGSHIAHFAHRSVDPGIVMLALFALLAAIPAAGMTVAVVRWLIALRRLKALRATTAGCELAGISYRRIESNETALFLGGFRKPEIFVTSGAERSLSPRALEAALLHEVAHIRAGDTRWRAAVAAVGGGFGLLPWVPKYLRMLVLQSELSADRAATRQGAQPGHLFEALVVASAAHGGAVGLTDGSVATRLEHLVDPQREVPEPPRPGALSIVAWAAGAPLLPHILLVAGFFGPPHISP